jgi:hypothetical protein
MTLPPLRGTGGRHRLGVGDLRHCRDIEAVRARLTRVRTGVHRRRPGHRPATTPATGPAGARPATTPGPGPAATPGPGRAGARPTGARLNPGTRKRVRPAVSRWAGTVGGTVVAGLLAVSGWYTAAGATAVAQMITR